MEEYLQCTTVLITVLTILTWSLLLVALQQAGRRDRPSWSRDSSRPDTTMSCLNRAGRILALVKLLLLFGELQLALPE
jgi:hypothetical protein